MENQLIYQAWILNPPFSTTCEEESVTSQTVLFVLRRPRTFPEKDGRLREAESHASPPSARGSYGDCPDRRREMLLHK